jgi:hypothetical protein
VVRGFSLVHDPEGSHHRNRPLRMTLLNKKGGDAYGKVPKRIAIATSQGEEKDAWPGQNALPYFLGLDGRGFR